MAKFHIRCSYRPCSARDVLYNCKSIEEVEGIHKCRACGRKEFRIDKDRMARNSAAEGCTCTGYAWEGNLRGAKHRRGSLACWYRKDGTQRHPGDPDFYDEAHREAHPEMYEDAYA